jgi:hypothetical protein
LNVTGVEYGETAAPNKPLPEAKKQKETDQHGNERNRRTCSSAENRRVLPHFHGPVLLP